MKKIIISMFSALLLLTGCQQPASNENLVDNHNLSTEICGFVKEIKENIIVIDIAEYITDSDTEKIAELGLTFNDMPDGYYINNPDNTLKEYSLTSETVFNFIDWRNDFVEKGADRSFSTTNKEDFIKYLNTYENALPGMPFFFEIADNSVISITEKIMM